MLKQSGGVTNPVMPKLIIPRHLRPCVCSLVTTETAASRNDTPTSHQMFAFSPVSSTTSDITSTAFRVNAHRGFVQLRNSTVATGGENKSQNKQKNTAYLHLTCYRNIPPSAGHTRIHTIRHTHTTRRLEVEFLCMKMETTKKKNETKSLKIPPLQRKVIRNLYTLHVFIKVTEPVRILDSSWI